MLTADIYKYACMSLLNEVPNTHTLALLGLLAPRKYGVI